MGSYISNPLSINHQFEPLPEPRGVLADRRRPRNPFFELRKEPPQPFTIEQLCDWYAAFVADRRARGIPEDGLCVDGDSPVPA